MRRPMKTVWKFLASLKLAVALLILLAVGAAVGTLAPQGGRGVGYPSGRGSSSGIARALQLDHVYGSIWFMALLGLFSLNTIACTASRLPAKFRRTFGVPGDFDAASLQGAKARGSLGVSRAADEAAAACEAVLRGRGFRVFRKDDGAGVRLTGRKRRLGLFGSDLVHAGLLVVIVGGVVSGLGSRSWRLALIEGGRSSFASAGFSVRLDKFDTEYYPGGRVKDWKSRLTVMENGRTAAEGTVEVNRPLRYKGYDMYQSAYGKDWAATPLGIELRKGGAKPYARTVMVKPGTRVETGDAEFTSVTVRNFVPDFVVGDNRHVESRSDEPNNAAAFVEVRKGEAIVFSGWTFANYPGFRMKPQGKTEGKSADEDKDSLTVVLRKPAAVEYSVIEVRRDPGTPFIWAGCLFVVLGLGLAFYWRPAEVRLALKGVPGGTEIAAGANGSAGAESLNKELETIIGKIRSGE